MFVPLTQSLLQLCLHLLLCLGTTYLSLADESLCRNLGQEDLFSNFKIRLFDSLCHRWASVASWFSWYPFQPSDSWLLPVLGQGCAIFPYLDLNTLSRNTCGGLSQQAWFGPSTCSSLPPGSTINGDSHKWQKSCLNPSSIP